MLQAINEFLTIFFFHLLYQLLLEASINNLIWTCWIITPLTCEERKEEYLISGAKSLSFFKLAAWSVDQTPFEFLAAWDLFINPMWSMGRLFINVLIKYIQWVGLVSMWVSTSCRGWPTKGWRSDSNNYHPSRAYLSGLHLRQDFV